MPRNQPEPQSSVTYKSAASLDVKFSRDDAAIAVPAFQNLPIELPAGGHYQVRIDGSDLHIYETSTGVKKYKPSDPKRIVDVEFNADTIEISCSGTAVKKIFLHTTPGVEDPKAITAKDLKVLPFLDEYEKLAGKSNPTTKDKERMIELVEQITNAYQEQQVESDANLPAAEEKKKQKQPKSTPSKPTYTPPQSSSGTTGESSYSPPPGYYGGGRNYGRSSG
jgi:hypothetical protein